MANVKNLKRGNPDTQFKSGQRAVEMGRKGGLAYGKSKTYQDIFKKMLSAPLNDDQRRKLEQFGIDPDEATYMTMMFASVMSTATKKGDFKAMEKTMELAGMSKRLETEQRVKEVELSIKERDLELREKQFEYQMAKDKGEVKEEEKVYIINDLEKEAKRNKAKRSDNT